MQPFAGRFASSHACCAAMKASICVVVRLSSFAGANRSSSHAIPNATASSAPNFACRALIRRLVSAVAICHQGALPVRVGLFLAQTAACSSGVAAAIVRSSRSPGMSPCAMRSSIAGQIFASRRSCEMARAVRLRATAIASFVHPAPAKASMARQRSTGPISARTTFSATATIGPASAPASSCTRTMIAFIPALIAAFTRR